MEPNKPIGFWSRSFNDTGRAGDPTHMECTAVLGALLILRPYLKGTRLKIGTDQDALRWGLILTNASGKLAHW